MTKIQHNILGHETDIDGWSPVWYGSAGMVGLGSLVYFFFARAEQQESIMQEKRLKRRKSESENNYTPPIDILDE